MLTLVASGNNGNIGLRNRGDRAISDDDITFPRASVVAAEIDDLVGKECGILDQ